MLKKRHYTFIVASHADARLWRLSLPSTVLWSLGLFAAMGVIAAGIAAFHYGSMVLKVVDYSHLLTENDSFRSENHDYRIRTAQLGEKIDFLEITARKLMVLSGMNSDRSVGGIGGYSKESFREPLPASAGTPESIDKYTKDLSTLEDQYRKVDEYISHRYLIESATPSILPLRGYVTGGVGRREDPFNPAIKDMHTGLDISAPYGTKVYAPADGTVLYAGSREGYGNIVVLDHKFGFTSRYGHLSRFNVQVGQRVSRHDIIGYVGTSGRTTGPHLHFEVWQFNRYLDPRKVFHNINGD